MPTAILPFFKRNDHFVKIHRHRNTDRVGGRGRSASSVSVDRHHRLSLPRPSICASSAPLLGRSSVSSASGVPKLDNLLLGGWTGSREKMPGLGSRGGSMIAGRGGGIGRRSSCYPGSVGLVAPTVNTPRRHSSRSGSEIGVYNFLGPKANSKNFSDDNMTTSKYLLVPSSHPLTSIPTVISGNTFNNGHNLNHRESLTADTVTERSTTSLNHFDNMFVSDGVHNNINSDKGWNHLPHPNSGDGNHQSAIKSTNSVAVHNGKRLQVRLQEDVERDTSQAEEDSPTLFTCYLLLGMTSFVTFWVMLMLRIYLPEKYWTWSYIW